jgi:V/A-type H+-transporting ATPase subunit C
MYAKLLKSDDYDRLLNMHSVPQVAAYLKKETSYAGALSEIDEENVHRGVMEQALKKSLFCDYEKLMKFCKGEYQDGLNIMFLSHEVSDLKLLISSVCTKHADPVTRDELVFIKNHGDLDAGLLAESETFERLVENLNGTRYYGMLTDFAGSEALDFYEIDKAIDKFNYKALMEGFKKRLGGSSAKAALSIYGTVIDITNIFNIYRLKKMRPNSSLGEIISRLIPYYYRMTRADFLELAQCEGKERLVDGMTKSKYGFLFPPDDENTWEDNYYKYLHNMYRRNLREHGFDIGVAMAYLFLKEIDIRNIITITECVRYSMPAPDIVRHIA